MEFRRKLQHQFYLPDSSQRKLQTVSVMLLIEEDYTGKYPDLLQVTPPFSAM